MKVLTLNVWQGRLERVLLKHLETLDVDFACMQEAVEYEGTPAGLASSYDKIGESLKLGEQFFSPLSSLQFGTKQISFGNVTYSRIPFVTTDTIFTKGHYTEKFDFDRDDYNIRAFQHASVDLDGKKLHFINHHGHHINEHKLGDDETLRQTRQIVEYIQQLDGAVILCADFNLSPESESIHLFDGVLRNLSVDAGLQTTRSKLTYKAEVCDYILVNDHVEVNDFSMDDTIISDHNALILDFDLK